MNLNKVMLIGRLGKKPEVNYVQPDLPVAKFSLATSEYYKDKSGNKIENTEWHNIVAWRALAKFAESYLDKGMLVYIEGKLQTRKWEAQDGSSRYSTDIITNSIQILEKREDRQGTQPAATPQIPESKTQVFVEKSATKPEIISPIMQTESDNNYGNEADGFELTDSENEPPF